MAVRRELVLTHVTRDNIAHIALVDRHARDLRVKRVPVTGSYDTSPELAPLLRDKRLVTRCDAADADGNVWLICDEGHERVGVSARGETVRCPMTRAQAGDIRGGEFQTEPAGRLFSEIVFDVIRDTGGDIFDKTAGEKIYELTGVEVIRTGGTAGSNTVEIRSQGRVDIDAIDLVYSTEDQSCEIMKLIVDCEVGELRVGCRSINMITYGSGKVRRVLVGDGVEELMVDDEVAELRPASDSCSLKKLTGFGTENADLSGFGKLNEFIACWCDEYRSTKVLDLRLPGAPDTVFELCFKHLRIQAIHPYTTVPGTLEFSGVKSVDKSFQLCSGFKHITGSIDAISASFIYSHVVKVDVVTQQAQTSFMHTVDIDDASDADVECVIHLRPLGAATRRVNIGGLSFAAGIRETLYRPVTLWDVGCDDGAPILELRLALGARERAIINSPVVKLCVENSDGVGRGKLTINCPVRALLSGRYPYPNVEEYGEGALRGVRDLDRVTVLSEGLRVIGPRAFMGAWGAKYIVIPRSVVDIGAAAFMGCSLKGGITTICVYRGSYGERWAKGKKIATLIIDSLEDIPKETVAKSEIDFLAAFVDTPRWADKSKSFVANLLYGGKVDLTRRITPVARLTDDMTRVLSGGDPAPLSETDAGRCAISAVAWSNIYGSRTGLLAPDVLRKFTWSVSASGGISRWRGEPCVSGSDVEACCIVARGDDVIYVGAEIKLSPGEIGLFCGECAYSPARDSTFEILSVESVFTDATVDQIDVGSGGNYHNVSVCGERLMGEALDVFKTLMQCGLVLVAWRSGEHSGKLWERITYFYCLETKKIYRFVGVGKRDAYSAVGIYRGEMSVEEFAAQNKKHFQAIGKRADALLSTPTADLVDSYVPRRAAPCFEAEFAMSGTFFDPASGAAIPERFKEFFSRSDIAEEITEAKFLQISGLTQLPLGSVSSASDRARNRYVVCVRAQDAVNCYALDCDPYSLSGFMRDRIRRRDGFSNPERGYFTDVTSDSEDVFKVRRIGEDYGKFTYLAIDAVSGKLVLLYEAHGKSIIVCSFSSMGDAVRCCEAMGDDFTRLLARSIDVFQGSVAVEALRGSIRLKNSLVIIGGASYPEGYEGNRRLVYEPILKYCRV
jgi:hypothetical protein